MCPGCGKTVPEDSIWLVDGVYYCTEPCARGSVHDRGHQPYPPPATQVRRG